MRYLAFILLLFAVATVQGQTLQGYVTDAVTGRALFPVTVVNVKTQQAVTTDERGFYTITAEQGDAVAFSFIGYAPVERTKPPSVIVATMNITLQPSEYRLKEFVYHRGNLTQYQRDSIERAKIYRVALQRRPPSVITSPVSALAEKFSSKAKQLYKFQQNFAAGEIEKFVDSRYTPTLVARLTSLEGDSIGHFMNTFPMPYDFARNASDLELQMWIRQNYKAWIKNQQTTDTAALK